MSGFGSSLLTRIVRVFLRTERSVTEIVTPAVPEVPQQTPEQIAATAEADFAKGYGKARGNDTPPEPAEKTDTAATATPEVAADGKTEATPENKEEKQPETPKVFGLTEAEFKAEMAKAGSAGAKVNEEVRKVYSKIGEINRTVQELTKNLSAGKTGRKITAEALKRVNDELPGLGAALAQDLSDILGGAEAAQAVAETKGQAFDPDKYHAEKLAPALEAMEARITKVSEEAQTELLSYMHSDYAEFLKTDTFKGWLQTLPADRREFVVTSPRAVVAGSAITEAKKWAEEKHKAEVKAKSKLEAAITPKGSGAAPVQQVTDDETAFNRGYKRARGK